MFHDAEHGGELIDALARHGDGLPANVLPVAVNEVTQVGLEAVAAAFAYGASAVRLLMRAKPRHDTAGLAQTVALAQPILQGLGFAGARVASIETDDPDALGQALRAIPPWTAPPSPPRLPPPAASATWCAKLYANCTASPRPRSMSCRSPRAHLSAASRSGSRAARCACPACSACPTGALSDDPEKPMLRFAEDACVQCGLCQAICPEKVIALKPQIDFRAATASSRIIKQEEPYACVRCGKPFGVKSSVERVVAKLEGQHWMFKDAKKRVEVIKMCADCRVNAMAEENFDPFGGPARPPTRTTEDYLRERDLAKLKQEYDEKQKS